MFHSIFTAAITALLSLSVISKSETKSEMTPNEQIIHQYFEHFNNHDWEAMASMYSTTADFKDPTLGNGVVTMTQAQTMAKYSELNAIFPDVHDRVVQTYSAGARNIIVEFVSTGTAPDGSTFELPICTIFTIENGKITKDFSYFDNFGN
ncbi:MAG: nuclear transport factor 2 family protein [Bacteroidota bacterium]